jgi:hypothetical protein
VLKYVAYGMHTLCSVNHKSVEKAAEGSEKGDIFQETDFEILENSYHETSKQRIKRVGHLTEKFSLE